MEQQRDRNTAGTGKPKRRPGSRETEAERVARVQREAQKQMTPDAEPDNTVEGGGSPGLTIMGGGQG